MPEPREYSESGQPIYRYPEPAQEWQPVRGGGDDTEAIVAHYERYLGPVENVWHELASDTVHIDVHHVPPGPDRNYHTLFTTGTSDLPMDAPSGAEDSNCSSLSRRPGP